MKIKNDGKTAQKKYRVFLWILLAVNLFGIAVYGYYLTEQAIPDRLKVQAGTYSADAQAVEDIRVMPVGAPVGIHVKTNGVMVLGTGKITDSNGTVSEPAKGLVSSGDYIVAIDGQPVAETSDVSAFVNACAGAPIHMELIRDSKKMAAQIIPVKNSSGDYMIGVWVRDDTQGIGTLSFVDENNDFAALGHGITDVDTGLLIDIKGGSLYPTQVNTIIKGEQGRAGEMVGTIYYSRNNRLGIVTENTAVGIFGTLPAHSPWRYDDRLAVDVGLKRDLRVGKAVLRCNVDGAVKDYDIEITGINYQSHQDNKDFIIEIVDPRLIAETNGIVQGMSGSPILQNGKLVGAVTHVLVKDPTRGYGIFIENMLEAVE